MNAMTTERKPHRLNDKIVTLKNGIAAPPAFRGCLGVTGDGKREGIVRQVIMNVAVVDFGRAHNGRERVVFAKEWDLTVKA